MTSSTILSRLVLCLLVIFSITCVSPCLATELKDLGVTDREQALDRAEQEKAKREYKAKMERERERSDAEKRIDGLQKPTVDPIFKKDGAGVKVGAPM